MAQLDSPLKQLTVENLRCFPKLSIELPSQLVITGPNGVGKSTVLEAVALLALTRSSRARRDEELIRTDAPYASVTGTLGDATTLRLVIERVGLRTLKRANRAGVAVPMSQLVGSLRVVQFLAEDLRLLTGSPQLRRQLLDRLLIQRAGARYAEQLATYYQTLRQRNALLARGTRGQLARELAPWDALLVQAAVPIVAARRELAAELSERVVVPIREVSQGQLTLTCHYRPNVDDLSRYEELLVARYESDRTLGATGRGPHRDDVELVLNGRPMSSASRGEQRAALVALKFAEYETLASDATISPLILFDDVFSELDGARRAELVRFLIAHPFIVTAADPSGLPKSITELPIIDLARYTTGEKRS